MSETRRTRDIVGFNLHALYRRPTLGDFPRTALEGSYLCNSVSCMRDYSLKFSSCATGRKCLLALVDNFRFV